MMNNINMWKMMKKILLLIGLILCVSLLANAVFAVKYEITLHSIEVKLGAEGNASIVEKFYLYFINDYYKKQFKEETTKLGIDLDEWKKFNQQIKPSLAEQSSIVPQSTSISFIEGADNYIELTYALKEPVMKKVNETSRAIEFELKKEIMNYFVEKPFYVIPEKTRVTFLLPREAMVKAEEILPIAEISTGEDYKIVSWQGLKKTTNMQLKYTYWKQLSPIISISLIIKGAIEDTRKDTQLMITVIVLVIAGMIYWKREKLNKKITSYVMRHTQFSEEEMETRE